MVPHRIDETRVLRNLGFDIESPIKHYYEWPARPGIKPFEAQFETSAFLTLNDRAFLLNDMGCVDADTEYLSPTGWKRIADYTEGEVGQYNPESKAVEFVLPEAFVKKPCEHMIRIKTKYGIDQLLSPEHRVLLCSARDSGKTEVVSALDLLGRHDAYTGGGRSGTRSRTSISFSQAAVPVTFGVPAIGVGMSDAEIRVQVAVIADGYFPPSLSQRCVVRLKKQRKKDRLRQLLSAAGIEWSETSRDTRTATGFTVFRFSAPRRDKEFNDYYWGMSPAQREIVCDEVMHWDGCFRKSGSEFSTYKKTSADFVQTCYVSCGYVARVLTSTKVREGKASTEYAVHVRGEKKASLQLLSTTTQTMWVEPSTDGFKYCFTVPTSFLVFRRNGCVFASGNTGKTLATLWAFDFLRSRKRLKKMFVVSPLSTLERTWGDEIFCNFPHLTFGVLHGDRQKRLDILAEDHDIYVINHDGVKSKGIVEALAKRTDIDLIVVDELASFRNAQTDRWVALNAICNGQKTPRWVWGLTGTPVPNAPTDAWGQCRLIAPGSVPSYFSKFRDMTMRKVSNFRWVAKDDALDVVSAAMRPAIRYKRSECVDLPPLIFETRHVEMTPEQARAYKQMKTRLKLEMASGQIVAANEAIKASKLLQICTGAVLDNNGDEVIIPATNRLEVVKEAIEEAGSKVIVFVPFRASLDYVAEYLRARKFSVEVIHGGVSKGARDTIFRDFQQAPNPRVIVAQPGTMSHGLTLTAANTIIWFAPVHSNETYQQALARISRPGQKLNQLIVMIEGTELERKIYSTLQRRESLQGTLLNLLKEDHED